MANSPKYMIRLYLYHTTHIAPQFAKEHAIVASALESGELNTYDKYKTKCKEVGIVDYPENIFNDYIKSKES